MCELNEDLILIRLITAATIIRKLSVFEVSLSAFTSLLLFEIQGNGLLRISCHVPIISSYDMVSVTTITCMSQ